jgi:Fe-S-cluster containining protein
VHKKLTLQTERAVADTQSAGTELAKRFERDLRATLADIRSTIMCTKGCAHCCHYPLTISIFEGVRIYRHLARHGLWLPSLKTLLKEHSEKTFGLSYELWLLSVTPCPLLKRDTNQCIAYIARPLACQITYSLGDPIECHPHRVSISNPLTARVEILKEYHRAEEKLFHANGAMLALVPISNALLLGEQLSGGTSLESLNLQVLKDFSNA